MAATVNAVRDTTRNVWVCISNGSDVDPERLVDLALSELGHTSRDDFPFGYDVRRYAVDRSALVILHKVDPHT